MEEVGLGESEPVGILVHCECEGPPSSIKFLGICINSVQWQLRLPEDKHAQKESYSSSLGNYPLLLKSYRLSTCSSAD